MPTDDVRGRSRSPEPPLGTGAPKLIASVLNADLDRLSEVCGEMEKAGLDGIQWDVMDGRFVPNLTMGPATIAACRKATSLPFEAHLMIEEPEKSIEQYAAAGCEYIIVHVEACRHLHRVLDAIVSLDVRVGVALNPATPLEAIAHVTNLIDVLLVMTVNPGFGGQSYIESMEFKIKAARDLMSRWPDEAYLEVDGGISPSTIAGAASAGADWFVIGSALFKHEGGMKGAVNHLRAEVERAPRRSWIK
ncbi:MAG: ribulose-phosphate 3-epimerase [Actinobacteria bacterium]|nr:ribulose-phosphate 3-epimerase [Actinomycetota bacterium]MDQ3532556.1 ribulose-phosphate 3-epimerase [Actinomycetota bacterium]